MNTNLERKVLLLDVNENVRGVITWERAVMLWFKERVRAPYDFHDYYDIQLTNGKVFKLPSALVLTEFKKIKFKKISPSRRNILKRDGYHCQYCGVPLKGENATVDHIIPQSRGGKDDWFNQVASCKKCNSHKGNRTPKEANLTLRTVPIKPNAINLVITQYDLTTKEQWSRWVQPLDS